jgi:hypothetical protein
MFRTQETYYRPGSEYLERPKFPNNELELEHCKSKSFFYGVGTRKYLLDSSIADPGCLSRIPDPDFYPSRIPDLGSRIPDPKTVPKEKDEKKFCYHTFFFCSHKFHKIEYYVIFEMLKKKIWANFQRIVEVFTQKFFTMLSNIWV